MYFELQGAQKAFQTDRRSTILSIGQFALGCLEDVAVGSRTSLEHIYNVQQVLVFLNDAEVTLKVLKKNNFTEIADYHGHVICPQRIKTASQSTNTLRRLKHPRFVADLKSFLGICNVFHRFLLRFARLAALRNKRIRKDKLATLDLLNKEKLTEPGKPETPLITHPIEALYNTTSCTTLDTYACSV